MKTEREPRCDGCGVRLVHARRILTGFCAWCETIPIAEAKEIEKALGLVV